MVLGSRELLGGVPGRGSIGLCRVRGIKDWMLYVVSQSPHSTAVS